MFQKSLDTYEKCIVNCLGYETAVRVEQIIFGLSMIFVGMVIMSFISASFILRLHSLEDFGKSKVKILRVDNGKKSTQIISIRNIKDAFAQVLLLSFSPFFTIKRFTERDEKRTKKFLIITCAIMAVIIILGVISTWSVLEPF